MKEITYVRLEPEVKRALSRLAEIDGRSLSALIAKIASDWVKAHQQLVDVYLKERPRAPAKEQRR